MTGARTVGGPPGAMTGARAAWCDNGGRTTAA